MCIVPVYWLKICLVYFTKYRINLNVNIMKQVCLHYTCIYAEEQLYNKWDFYLNWIFNEAYFFLL